MDENKLGTIKEFKLNLNKSNDKTIGMVISELKNLGFEEVNVKIEGRVEDLLKKSGYSIDVFHRVKKKQDLPDWVVYDLIDSSGKLQGTKIGQSFSDE